MGKVSSFSNLGKANFVLAGTGKSVLTFDALLKID